MYTQNPYKTKLIVVAHTPLASALLAVVAHVHGSLPSHVFAIDVKPNDSQTDVAQRVTALLQSEDTLIFTDLLGATPHNGALSAIHSDSRTTLIHSVNAPLLLRALNYSHLPAQALHDKLTLG
jgi:PTS system ascorbate-specific IIA component